MPTTDLYYIVVRARSGTMIINRNDRNVGQSVVKHSEFADDVNAVFSHVVRASDTAEGAGTNVGAGTVALPRLVGPQGHVYAFAPQLRLFQPLSGNLALSQSANVYARQEELSDIKDSLFVPNPYRLQINNFGEMSPATKGTAEAVAVITVDSLGLSPGELFKVDAESLELSLVNGASDTFVRCRPVRYLENDRQEKSATLLERWLSLGYRACWHTPPLYHPDNFNCNLVNHFESIVSINISRQPSEPDCPVAHLRETLNPTEK